MYECVTGDPNLDGFGFDVDWQPDINNWVWNNFQVMCRAVMLEIYSLMYKCTYTSKGKSIWPDSRAFQIKMPNEKNIFIASNY